VFLLFPVPLFVVSKVNNNEDNNSSGNGFGEDRTGLKVSLKLFLYNAEREEINRAIDRGLEESSVDYLDTLVLSFPGQDRHSRLTLETIQETWLVLEANVLKNRVKMIGICDLDPQLFIQLYNWATVKPSIVQINLSSCCVVPPELSSFCKENGVQLLTHSDPMGKLVILHHRHLVWATRLTPNERKEIQLLLTLSIFLPDILGDDKVGELMKPLESQLKGEDTGHEKQFKWELKWILRYQIHLKTRGVLASKGYAASVALV